MEIVVKIEVIQTNPILDGRVIVHVRIDGVMKRGMSWEKVQHEIEKAIKRSLDVPEGLDEVPNPPSGINLVNPARGNHSETCQLVYALPGLKMKSLGDVRSAVSTVLGTVMVKGSALMIATFV